MITSETLDKLYSIFSHLQIVGNTSVQLYDNTQEYRCYCIWAKGLDWKRNCQTVHVNFPLDKLRPWHLKMWDKRKKEIPNDCEIVYLENYGVVRFCVK